MLKKSILSSIALLAVVLVTTCASAKNPKTTVFHVAPLGSIQIENPSGLRFTLRLDGREIGVISPNERFLLDQAPLGTYRIDAVYPGKLSIPTQTFRAIVTAHSTVKIRIQKPMGSLKVKNRNAIPLTLFIDGARQSLIRPGAELFLGDIAPGKHTLRLRGIDGRLLQEKTLRVRPGRTFTWIPAELTGSFRLKNKSHKKLRVFIDGKFAGMLGRNKTRVFTNIPIGSRRVELRSHGKVILERNLNSRPAKTTQWIVSPKKFAWHQPSHSVGFVIHD